MKTKKNTATILWRLSLVSLLPAISASLESFIDDTALDAWVFWKWLVFWVLGIGLFWKGIRLASSQKPASFRPGAFTGKELYSLLLELGFANMALGSMGILSVLNDQWRSIAAITGAVYFALRGIVYLFKK
jgi:hypothetical protein